MVRKEDLQSGQTYYILGKKRIIPVIAAGRFDGIILFRTAYKDRRNYQRKPKLVGDTYPDLWKSEEELAWMLLEFFEKQVNFATQFLNQEENFLREAIALAKKKHAETVKIAERESLQKMRVAAAIRRQLLAMGAGLPWYEIRSTTEKDLNTGAPLYWSNEFGWADEPSADLYSAEDTLRLNLPISGEWVEAT